MTAQIFADPTLTPVRQPLISSGHCIGRARNRLRSIEEIGDFPISIFHESGRKAPTDHIVVNSDSEATDQSKCGL